MLTFHVDLGQIIIASLIAIVGWMVKKMLSSFEKRLDKHDETLIGLVKDVGKLIGYYEGFKKVITIGERE